MCILPQLFLLHQLISVLLLLIYMYRLHHELLHPYSLSLSFLFLPYMYIRIFPLLSIMHLFLFPEIHILYIHQIYRFRTIGVFFCFLLIMLAVMPITITASIITITITIIFSFCFFIFTVCFFLFFDFLFSILIL